MKTPNTKDARRIHCKAIIEKAVGDAAEGRIRAFVSVYGVTDYDDEVMDFGCFAKSLAKKLPKGVWMHRWDQPVAITEAAVEVPANDERLPMEIRSNGGLMIDGRFNLGTQRGKEAFSDLQFGTVDEFSIGFYPKAWRVDDTDKCLHFTDVELFEWSPVLVGANPATVLVETKDGLTQSATIGHTTDEPMTLEDHSDTVLTAIKEYADRIRKLKAIRNKEGRQLSEANRQRLLAMLSGLEEIIEDMEDLLEAAAPLPTVSEDDVKSRVLAEATHLSLETQHLTMRGKTANDETQAASG